jgi:hypothetical protein
MTTELPFKMERFYHRVDYKNGELTVVFRDAAHLVDAWNFAVEHNKEAEFNRAIMKLVRLALGATLPQRESTWPDGTHFDAHEGINHKITIHPDSHEEPSFLWQEEKGMVGGLIWHQHSGDWSIHT